MTLKDFFNTNCILPDTVFKILAKDTPLIHQFTGQQLSHDKSHFFDYKELKHLPIGDDVLNAHITAWGAWITVAGLKFTIYIDKNLEELK